MIPRWSQMILGLREDMTMRSRVGTPASQWVVGRSMDLSHFGLVWKWGYQGYLPNCHVHSESWWWGHALFSDKVIWRRLVAGSKPFGTRRWCHCTDIQPVQLTIAMILCTSGNSKRSTVWEFYGCSKVRVDGSFRSYSLQKGNWPSGIFLWFLWCIHADSLFFLVDQSYCFVVVFLGVGTIQRLFARRLRTKAPKAMRLGPECSKAIAKWVWIQMSPLTSTTTIKVLQPIRGLWNLILVI